MRDISILHESISFEITINKRQLNFMTLYQFPNQNRGVLETFLENLGNITPCMPMITLPLTVIK